MYIIILSGHQ